MKTIIVGFDAFDPSVFEHLYSQGKMPNLGKYLENGGYARFKVSNPAQSEVSWTSIATGLNPGGHGLFDFVHRNPADYSLHVSLLPTKRQLFGIQFTPPHTAQTIFDYAVQQGYPATVLWWPATFPARFDSPVHTIPGLGTPDIMGRLGVGTFFSPDPGVSDDNYKTKVDIFQHEGKNTYKGLLRGPIRKKGSGSHQATINFQFELHEKDKARLMIGKQDVHLRRGKWSPIIHFSFKIKLGISVHAITQVIWNDHHAEPGLYFLPLQIHPLHSPWPYATPPGFVKKNWNTYGPFLTLGWPQDTTGLEEGFIHDDQFLYLCDTIFSTRQSLFMKQIQDFQEGILAIVFDSLDRVQHMFWRDRPDIIERWYIKLDSLFGRIQHQIGENEKERTQIIVVSDHGFANFEYKVHLNRWLIEHGYLVPKELKDQGKLDDVDWIRSRAYAIGLSSIYLNLADREIQGIVKENDRAAVIESLRDRLLQWKGPDNRKVVQNVWLRKEAFDGPLAEYGPDMVVGFNTGYRASAQTGLGEWKKETLEPNRDHWGADHCMDPALVQGVLFSNTNLENISKPSYRDIPELVIGHPLNTQKTASHEPPDFSDEDEEILKERLRDLGYL